MKRGTRKKVQQLSPSLVCSFGLVLLLGWLVGCVVAVMVGGCVVVVMVGGCVVVVMVGGCVVVVMVGGVWV